MQFRSGFLSRHRVGRLSIVPSAVALAPYRTEAHNTEQSTTSTSSAGRLHLVDDLGLDEEQADWFARHRPELLHAPTPPPPPEGSSVGPSSSTNETSSRLATRVVGLADLLGCTAAQAAAMLQKQPALIDCDSGAIRRRLDGLVRAFGGGDSIPRESIDRDVSEDAAAESSRLKLQLQAARQSAAQAARRVPVLLASDDHSGAGVLEGRLAKLTDLLACGDAAVAVKLAREEPQLLVLDPGVLRARVEALTGLLDLAGGEQRAAQLFRKHPWMMTYSSRSLEVKVSAMSASLGLPRKETLEILVSYPPLLTLSVDTVSSKVNTLSDHIPLEKLKAMVRRQPSLLARSTDKVLRSLKALRSVTGKSMQSAISLTERRPSILTKSSSTTNKCFRALSIWKLTTSEKEEIVQKHPSILTLSPTEVHHRCRWLRGLVLSNGYYHSGTRRIPAALLGVILMHLPQAWGRLQYLTDCNQESRIGLMDAVQMREGRFQKHFPQYKRWLQFRTSEMGCTMPWRQSQKRKDKWQPELNSQDGSAGGDSSEPHSWHAARGASGPRPKLQSVLSEAKVVYYGMHRVHKPQRRVWSSSDQASCAMCEVEES